MKGKPLVLIEGSSRTLSVRLYLSLGISQVRRYSSGRGQMGQSGSGPMNVFDRGAKRRQKNRAAVADDVATYDYLRDEVCTYYV